MSYHFVVTSWRGRTHAYAEWVGRTPASKVAQRRRLATVSWAGEDQPPSPELVLTLMHALLQELGLYCAGAAGAREPLGAVGGTPPSEVSEACATLREATPPAIGGAPSEARFDLA